MQSALFVAKRVIWLEVVQITPRDSILMVLSVTNHTILIILYSIIGGCCSYCGSVEHLKVNCPDKHSSKQGNAIGLHINHHWVRRIVLFIYPITATAKWWVRPSSCSKLSFVDQQQSITLELKSTNSSADADITAVPKPQKKQVKKKSKTVKFIWYTNLYLNNYYLFYITNRL